MTFTYDLTASGTALAVAKMRLQLGDQYQGTGVLPNGINLSDEELLTFYADSGSVGGGAASAASAISHSWARLSDLQAGPLKQAFSQTSARWAQEASRLTALLPNAGHTSFAGKFGRQDGYAYRAGSVDVAP
jgi:hypothetical protein